MHLHLAPLAPHLIGTCLQEVKTQQLFVQGGIPGASIKRAPQRSVTSQLKVGARRYCRLAN